MRGVKNYKQPSIVSGLTVKEILSLEPDKLMKLNKKDLQKITGRLVSAGNKRIRRAREQDITSPAFAYVENEGGLFSTKGKTINQLRTEFVRARNFLTAETSTIKGAKKFKSESIALLKKEGVVISSDNFDRIMKLYETLRKNDKTITERSLKYNVFKELENIVDDNRTNDDILSEMTNKINKIYEDEQRRINSNGGVSGFFNMGSNS